MKRYIFIALCLFFGTQMLWSQDRKEVKQPADSAVRAPDFVYGHLVLQAKGYPDRMALRWGVNNAAVWPFLQQTGFHIDYVELDKDNKRIQEDWVRLTTEAVKPWSREQFQQEGALREDDDNMLIAAQALYGQLGVGEVNPTDKEAIQQADMAFNNLFILAMMAADFSPKAAEALGLYYTHPLSVDKEHKYAYRIYAAEDHPVFKTDTAYYVYAGFALEGVVAPDFVQARGGDGLIEVYWPRNSAYNTFTSYNVERSTDSVHFERLNERPLVFDVSDSTQLNYVFADSVDNYRKYYYRVNGVDAFGDTSYYSAPVSAMATNQLSPDSPTLRANLNFTKDKVELNWTKKEDKERPLRGFIIRRGADKSVLDEAIHPELLPPDTKFFEDKPQNLTDGLYYQIISIDTSGNYAFSNIAYVFAFDTIPPKAPVGLKGQIDTTGRVELSWDMDYTDNVYAYRVFASNHPDNSFSPVTAALVQDTVFVDSISFTLSNRYIYYKVVALDGNNNHSEMSETLELTRPKMVASPAPVIHSFNVSDKTVSFKFDVYPDEETTHLIIFRKKVGEDDTAEWIPIDTLSATAESYQDTTVATGTRYQYMVRSLDVFDMLSESSFPLEVFVYHVARQAPDIGFRLRKDDKSGVTLTWTPPKEKVRYYILYKDTGSGMEQFKSLEAIENSFKEESANVLRYGIKVVYEDKDVDSPLVIKEMR